MPDVVNRRPGNPLGCYAHAHDGTARGWYTFPTASGEFSSRGELPARLEARIYRTALALTVIMLSLMLGAAGSRLGTAVAAGGSTLNRPEDPVVLTGAVVPSLTGAVPSSVVGFRWDGAWTQIPVQIDERDTKTFTTVYDGAVSSSSITELFYTDPATWTGADSDPTFDADDELAFMSQDAGGQAPSSSAPSHTIAGSAVQTQDQ